MKSKALFGALAVVMALPAAANAAVVVADYTFTNDVFPVSNTDLLQTNLLATNAVGNFQEEGAAGVTALTDGGFGTTGNQCCGGLAATADGNETLTYTLDGAFNLTSIDTFAGWDQYRGGQSYTVSYATAAAPTTFITLASVFNNSFNGVDDISTRANITSTSGWLASNVVALKFQFNGDLQFGYAGYREFDVFGSAVPEPASWALMILGFGMVGVAARRRQPSVAA